MPDLTFGVNLVPDNDQKTLGSTTKKWNVYAGQVVADKVKGSTCTASGDYAHAEGFHNTANANYSHAEGGNNTASGFYAHAEGGYSTASGPGSHAEGSHTAASGDYSHAEGSNTTASEFASHAEGQRTEAIGSMSHAEGNYTIANHSSQHVFGAFNVADPSTAMAGGRGNYIEIVGNGTATEARSNARTLDWSGNEYIAGALSVGDAAQTRTNLGAVGISDIVNNLTSTEATAPLSAAQGKALNDATAPIEWNSSSQYGTILDFMLAQKDKNLPISFVKVGNFSVSDSPFNGNDEFTGVISGAYPRMTVEVKTYANSSVKSAMRNTYQDAYYGDWKDVTSEFMSVTVSAGLTGATGVTVNSQLKMSIGRLRVYEIVFTTSASIAADTALVTGFDSQSLAMNGIPLVGPLFNNGAHGDSREGYLNTSNALCCTTAIGSGDMRRCTVIYIAQ